MAWTYKTTHTPGWDSGARTVETLDGNGAFAFTVGQAIGIVCGFNDSDDSTSYLELDHAFWIEAGKVRVIEGGVFKTAFTAYAHGATFLLERVEGVVSYTVGGVPFYTSVTPSSGTVFLDCALFAHGDTINGATTVSDPRYGEYVSVGLPPLAAAGVVDAEIIGSAVIPPLAAVGSSDDPIIGTVVLPPIAAAGADSWVAYGRAVLPPLAAHQLETPDVVFGSAQLPALTGTGSVDEPATGQVLLPPMGGFGTPETGVLGLVVLPPLAADCMIALSNTFLDSWPRWTLDCRIAINGAWLEAPPAELTAHATTHRVRAALEAPVAALVAFGGASAKLVAPAATLTAHATSETVARAALEAPVAVLVATALAGSLASAELEAPPAELRAWTGAVATLKAPVATLVAHATTSGIARAALAAPAATLTAHATTYGFAWAVLEAPVAVIFAGDGNRARLEAPVAVLSAFATYRGTTAEAAAETTVAVNLTTGAVTQLLLGGFEKLVTAHGRLYGLKNGALTRLDGEVDGTRSPIPATVRFAPQTFGTARVKRMSEVYLEGRAPDGVTLDVVADETTARRYQVAGGARDAYGTRRIKTGKGVQFHSCGLVLRNRDGGEMDVGGMELRVAPLSRRLP